MANATGVEDLAAYLADTTLTPPIADLSTLDSHLSALVVGPKFIHPQQFMPDVLGPKADLSLTEGTEALHAIHGIAAAYNRIATTLSDPPRAYAPRFGWSTGRWLRGPEAVVRRGWPGNPAAATALDASTPHQPGRIPHDRPILAHASRRPPARCWGRRPPICRCLKATRQPTIAAAVVTLHVYGTSD